MIGLNQFSTKLDWPLPQYGIYLTRRNENHCLRCWVLVRQPKEISWNLVLYLNYFFVANNLHYDILCICLFVSYITDCNIWRVVKWEPCYYFLFCLILFYTFYTLKTIFQVLKNTSTATYACFVELCSIILVTSISVPFQILDFHVTMRNCGCWLLFYLLEKCSVVLLSYENLP